MFGPETDTDEACAHPARERGAFEQPQGPRRTGGFGLTQTAPDLLLDDPLHALREASGKGTAALYFCEMIGTYSASAKGLCQYIGRSDRILDG